MACTVTGKLTQLHAAYWKNGVITKLSPALGSVVTTILVAPK